VDRRIVASCAGFVVGFTLWLVFPHVFGRPAWDGGVAYLGALFAAGAAVGALDRPSVWTGPLGLYLGQVAAVALRAEVAAAGTKQPHPALDPLFLVGVTLCALAGSAAVASLPQWAAWDREVRGAGAKDR
jgi:hypothetical protein